MPSPEIKKFKGLNNVTDGLRLSQGWLAKADNIDITDTGAIRRRAGYSTALSGTFGAAYNTLDFKRLYAVMGGAIVAIDENMHVTTLRSGIGLAPMYWAEFNQDVYYSNGVNKGIIGADGSVRDWSWTSPHEPALTVSDGALPAGYYQVALTYSLPDGRETGASAAVGIVLRDGQMLTISDIPQLAGNVTNVYIAPADSTVFQLAFTTKATALTWNEPANDLGMELQNPFLDPPPTEGTILQVWEGQMYLSQYLPEQNVSVIWFSLSLGLHLFDNKNYVIVPGECLLLCPTESALIIGTASKIFSLTAENLTEEADYGVVPGYGWATDEDETILLWSVRGLCRLLPFSNLTLKQMSVQSGTHAGVAIVYKDGYKRFVAVLKAGGVAFNRRG